MTEKTMEEKVAAVLSSKAPGDAENARRRDRTHGA